MPFDPSEFQDEPAYIEAEAETQAVKADAIIKRLAPQETQVDEASVDNPNDTDYMFEVEQRLDVASHYHQLLQAPLFNETTAASQIVEREHRAFVKERLEVLLGIRQEKDKQPPPPKQSFDDEEVAAIKILIASMIKKGMIAATPAPKPAAEAPSVRVAAPPQPRQAPTVVARPAPVAAQRTAPAPQPVKPQPAKPPAPAPRKPGRPPKTDHVVTVDHPVTGEPYDMLVKVQQKPAGAIPFPSEQGLEMAAMMQASHAAGSAPAGLINVAAIVAERTKNT